MNSTVAQRTKFFGMMRCIGASKKQIIHFVRLEALNWCKTAIPIEELKAGQLDGKVIHCVRGVKVSEYDVEPLILKDIEGQFYAHGLLTDLQNTVASLTKTVRIQEEKIEKLEIALAEEIEVKEELLAKFKDYADNGVEVTFKE